MSPLPARGTGSCGPAVSSSAPRTESAAATATMGGKNKQRTKGNLRPSNSGRAAELLAKEQGTVPGFIGFGTSHSDFGYVPAIQGAEDIDSLVDSDFRMVLRKLSKKDVTTKLKAMQEFGTMCTERDPEAVKGVLPYWPRIFCKISLDHDRRVREATQQAFEKLILKVKKHLAPYLKSVMGYWLMAQCDTYPPAATAAKDAFEAAFPPSKQPEAIVFCKEEITSVLQDHLLKETPDTLSDPQTVPEEEREAKFHRVVTCSLLALKKLLCFLPNNELDSLEDKFKSLLSQNKFWKYGKHNVPQIRSAYFELISALCQHVPQVMKEEASKVSPSVLLSIDDSDPAVCPALWEAVLYTVTTVEECWLHVNAKKSVFPKLTAVVREGGRGLAAVIYPYLLPFISKLPPSITEPKLDFFKHFLTSVITGLSTERTKASFSECSAVVSAFFECLRFIMQQSLGEEDMEQMLINEQLIPFIDTVLKDPGLQHRPLFNHLADTISAWEAKVDAEKDAETVYNLENVLLNFWERLSEICVEKISEPEVDVKTVLGVSSLVGVLQKPKSLLKLLKSNRKKTGRVRFAIEEPEAKKENEKCASSEGESSEGSEKATDSSDTHKSSDLVSPLRKKPLEDLVCKLAEVSIAFVNEQKSEQHLQFLSTLLDSFSSDLVFKVLLGDEQKNIIKARPLAVGKLAQENPAVQFLYHKLVGWLNESKKKDGAFLVDILYSALRCCDSDLERKHVLDDLTKEDLKCTSLLQVIEKTTSENQALYSVPLVQLFACVSFDLACDLSAFFDSMTPDIIGNLPVNLISEWKEFFSKGIHSLLLPLLVTAIGENKDLSETSFQNAMLKPMCETLTYISKDQLLSHKLPVRSVAGQKTNLPEHLQTLLNTLTPLLLFRARPVQIAAYHMLYKLMPELPQYDQDNLKSYGDEEEDPALSPPAALMSLLSTQEDLLEKVLGCVPVGQIVTVKPLSEDFCYVLGYLLTWKLILTFFKAASSQVKARATTREVMATYTIEDIVIELIIQLPSNYPLGSITVESGKRIGVAVQQWRNWMLQLSTYLTHQVCLLPRSPFRQNERD
ncbi:listerin E3 ubiquitin protein ligase 1 [Cricetulus griseus]